MSTPNAFALGGFMEDDDAILMLFRQWVEGTRATAAACRSGVLVEDNEVDEAVRRDHEVVERIAKLPANGAVGLAIKAYLALHVHYATYDDAAALSSMDHANDAEIGLVKSWCGSCRNWRRW